MYSANPSAQSIPLNGYKYASGLLKTADIMVIAHKRDQKSLLQSDLKDNLCFAGSKPLADLVRRIGCFFFKGRWNLISLFDFWDYLYFDLDCLKVARKLHKEHGFDAILRMTPTTPQWPSLIYKVGIPVITGPHNGGMSWPHGFRHLARKGGTGEVLRVFGKLTHSFYSDLDKYSRILCANKQCAEVFGEVCKDRILEISENGVDQIYPPSKNSGDATKLLFVGRLIPCRCLDVLLKAIARLPNVVRLTIVGDGPMRNELEMLSEKLGLSDRVEFVGQIRQSETTAFMDTAGVFVFPSVRDSGGLALLEAMSHALPVVVAKWGGPFQYVGDDYGISLSVDSPQELENGLVRSIQKLLVDHHYGRELGLKARKKIQREFLWGAKARLFVEIVKDTLPNFDHTFNLLPDDADTIDISTADHLHEIQP
ncbi:MAG: glycosyltransferase family 4 protein [Phycisphaeraceae bacterium]|nr:glycosyltransferase family 4 protein [Phycisphaeraceae bacterium]